MLETPRLLLDTWESAQWIDFRPMAQDPEVMRYITGGIPWPEERVREFVDLQVKHYAERGFCRWRVLDRVTSNFMGFCGVGFWRDALDPEIGWWLARQYWGCGFATEAARRALADIFERVGLEKIISVASPYNVASTRVMEKLGLVRQREFENAGVVLVQYGISRDGYLSQTGAV